MISCFSNLCCSLPPKGVNENEGKQNLTFTQNDFTNVSSECCGFVTLRSWCSDPCVTEKETGSERRGRLSKVAQLTTVEPWSESTHSSFTSCELSSAL